MRVLIVKISALGDVVHALPVLAYIKSANPEAKIDWLVEEAFAPLLEGHEQLCRVLRLGLKRWRREGLIPVIKGVWRTLRALRRERYDLVLDLQGNCKSGLFTRFCGAPRRFGFSFSGVREWPNVLATNCKVQLTAAEHHVSDQALAVARKAFPFGSVWPLVGSLGITEKSYGAVEKQLVDHKLDDRPLLVLQYGTTWSSKFWPLERWKELVRKLCQEDGLRPVLIWGNETEKEVCREIFQASDEKAVIWPRGTLQELAALLQRADVVVGGDTGPVHIAAAVGTATVSLYTSSDGSRSGPRGERHIQLQSPWDCSPCFKRDCPEGRDCGSSIEVEAVLSAIRQLLSDT